MEEEVGGAVEVAPGAPVRRAIGSAWARARIRGCGVLPEEVDAEGSGSDLGDGPGGGPKGPANMVIGPAGCCMKGAAC